MDFIPLLHVPIFSLLLYTLSSFFFHSSRRYERCILPPARSTIPCAPSILVAYNIWRLCPPTQHFFRMNDTITIRILPLMKRPTTTHSHSQEVHISCSWSTISIQTAHHTPKGPPHLVRRNSTISFFSIFVSTKVTFLFEQKTRDAPSGHTPFGDGEQKETNSNLFSLPLSNFFSECPLFETSTLKRNNAVIQTAPRETQQHTTVCLESAQHPSPTVSIPCPLPPLLFLPPDPFFFLHTLFSTSRFRFFLFCSKRN